MKQLKLQVRGPGMNQALLLSEGLTAVLRYRISDGLIALCFVEFKYGLYRGCTVLQCDEELLG